MYIRYKMNPVRNYGRTGRVRVSIISSHDTSVLLHAVGQNTGYVRTGQSC